MWRRCSYEILSRLNDSRPRWPDIMDRYILAMEVANMKKWWCLKFHKYCHKYYSDRLFGRIVTIVVCPKCNIDWIKEDRV